MLSDIFAISIKASFMLRFDFRKIFHTYFQESICRKKEKAVEKKRKNERTKERKNKRTRERKKEKKERNKDRLLGKALGRMRRSLIFSD